MLLFIVLITITTVLYAIHRHVRRNQEYWSARGVPTVDLAQFGSKWDRVTQVIPPDQMEIKIYAAAKATGARFFGLIQNGVPVFIPLELELIKALAVKDFEHFRNRRLVLPPLEFEPLMRKMLISAKDQEWKDLRSIVSPTFSPLKLREMFPIFSSSSAKLEEFLKSKGDQDVEFVDVFARYTVDIIASVAFGLEDNTFKNSEFFQMANRFQNQFGSAWGRVKLFLIYTCPTVFKWFGIRLADPSVCRFFVRAIQDTLRNRKKTGEKRQDFLQQLVDVKETGRALVLGKPLTNEQVYAHCILFFLGGFESPQALLIYTAYELALNPDIQENLYQEVKAAGEVSCQTVAKMELLDRIFHETLRKYPTVRNDRVCNEDYKIPDSDVIVRKGTVISFPAYGLHHDPDLFPDPQIYDPDRFLPQNKEGRNPFSYHPFGHGPRACIGRNFALLEGKTAIAQLILKFELKPVPRTEIPIQNEWISTALRPKHGLYLSAKPRPAAAPVLFT